MRKVEVVTYCILIARKSLYGQQRNTDDENGKDVG